MTLVRIHLNVYNSKGSMTFSEKIDHFQKILKQS